MVFIPSPCNKLSHLLGPPHPSSVTYFMDGPFSTKALYCTYKIIIHKVHSFIHYGDLYSAPSRLLLRSAPNPCTAKKKSLETKVECVRKNPGKQSLRQRKPIPHRGTNHRECTGLCCGCTSKRNKE